MFNHSFDPLQDLMDLQRAQLEVNTRIVELQTQRHQTLLTQQQIIQAMNKQASALNDLNCRLNALWTSQDQR